MNLRFLYFFCFILFYACAKTSESTPKEKDKIETNTPFITILGIAQDGGYPHINNTVEFEKVSTAEKNREKVVSLGLVDPKNNRNYLFEATPDLPSQLDHLQRQAASNRTDGVFLTHAHMGHYTGLMYFGREAMGG